MQEKITQNKKYMKKISIKDVLSRLKIALDIRTDESLADIFGISKRNLATWKQRNSMDYEFILDFAINQSINTNWLLTGIGDMMIVKEECVATPPIPLAFEDGNQVINVEGILNMKFCEPWLWHYCTIQSNNVPSIALEKNDFLIIRKMVKDKPGILSFTNSKYCVWYDFNQSSNESSIKVINNINNPNDEISEELADFEYFKEQYFYYVEYVIRRPIDEKNGIVVEEVPKYFFKSELIKADGNDDNFVLTAKTTLNDISEYEKKIEQKRLSAAKSKLIKPTKAPE